MSTETDVDQAAVETAPEQTAPEESGAPAGPAASEDLVAKLEREGDIAADYLEELLDIADLDGDLDMDVEADRAAVSIVGADLSQLVGEDGKVLEALQELTRLAVYRETGERSRLMLDISGFRADKRSRLPSWARRWWRRSAPRASRCRSTRCPPSSARSFTTPSPRPGCVPSPRAWSRDVTSSCCPRTEPGRFT